MSADPARPSVLFVDVTCPAPYGPQTLADGVLGGTEATVLRVAEGLAGTHDVSVLQHNRRSTERSPAGVRYLRGQPADLPDRARHVVLLRHPLFLAALRRRYPGCDLRLWLHDHPGVRIPASRDAIAASNAEVVTVSRYLERRVRDALVPGAAVRTLHNPVPEDLIGDGRAFDPHRLVFLSARERGLSEARSLHAALRAHGPFELHIIAPLRPDEARQTGAGVVDWGPLPHREAMAHLRGALCLFYPNDRHPETFGLVMAEANAVGTPALVHDFGAAREVTCLPEEVIDVRVPGRVLGRVLAWSRGGRPKVWLRDELRTEAVLASWRGVLG